MIFNFFLYLIMKEFQCCQKKKKTPNKKPICFQSFYFSEKINVKLCSLTFWQLLPYYSWELCRYITVCLQTPLEKALLITGCFAKHRFSCATMSIKVTFSQLRYSAFLLTTDRRISCQKNTLSRAYWQTFFNFLLALHWKCWSFPISGLSKSTSFPVHLQVSVFFSTFYPIILNLSWLFSLSIL